MLRDLLSSSRLWLLALVVLLIVLAWLNRYKYVAISADDGADLYRVNTWTGETCVLMGPYGGQAWVCTLRPLKVNAPAPKPAS